jgi:hypothetical protein
MIKAEVIFDGDEIHCKGKMICFEQLTTGDFHVVDGDLFNTLEEAIKYCLECDQ